MNTDLLEARQQFDQITDWLSAQAVVLASNVIAGGHCPVCGSVERPAPAISQVHFLRNGNGSGVRRPPATCRRRLIQPRTKLAPREVGRPGAKTGNLVTQLAEAAFASVSQLAGQLEATHQQ